MSLSIDPNFFPVSTPSRHSPQRQPVKVFVGHDFFQKPTQRSPAQGILGPKNTGGKFTFKKLTIDVEEANKMASSELKDSNLVSLKRSSVLSPPRTIEVSDEKPPGIQDVSFINQFYKEQMERLAQKNETLLRENERLRLELDRVKSCDEENKSLKAQIDTLEKRYLQLENKQKESDQEEGQFRFSARIRGRTQSSGHCDCCNCNEERAGSRSGARISLEKKGPQIRIPNLEGLDEYLYLAHRKTTEDGNSINLDAQEQVSGHLRDFISKLKQASEGIKKPGKSNPAHKKTSSLATSQLKKKESGGIQAIPNRGKDNSGMSGMRLSQSSHFKLGMGFQKKETKEPSKKGKDEKSNATSQVSKRGSLRSSATFENGNLRQAVDEGLEILREHVDFNKNLESTSKIQVRVLLQNGRSMKNHLQEDERSNHWTNGQGKKNILKSRPGKWTRPVLSHQNSFD